MLQLRSQYRGERAVVIMGGPTLIQQNFDFQRLRDRGFVTFLETKALTPQFLASGLTPDFYLMLFPEKAKDNALQHFIYNSFLGQFNIKPLLRASYQPTVDQMRHSFAECFEPGNASRGAHKRYRWQPDAYLPGSPMSLLTEIPKTCVIANSELLDTQFPHHLLRNPVYKYGYQSSYESFDLERYFSPVELDGQLALTSTPFMNSAAIALFPLLAFMGFRQVFMLGMDMSMLGSMEYAAPYTFKSMLHYLYFFVRARRTFSAGYKPNLPFYLRPRSEFADLRYVWNQPWLDIRRVYEPSPWAARVDGVKTVSYRELLA